MTDVLLINAPVNRTRHDTHASLSPPLGLGYIAAFLRQHGYTVSGLDLNISGLNLVRIKKIVAREKPKVLGVSADTETYLNGLQIAQAAKEVNPDLKVVFGGPHPTIMYQDAAQESCIDYVVRGEGEYTMLELMNALIREEGDPARIEGLAFVEDGEIRVTPDRCFLADVDELPFPARDLFPTYLYDYPGNVLMSRGGCPFNCSFCAVNNIWQGGRRYRKPENVVAEIIEVLKSGVEEINFADDTFTLNREHTIELCRHLQKVSVPVDWSWTCSTRVDLIDRELLQMMKDAGCSSVQYGVETGSAEVLDVIGKRITLKQVVEGVEMAREVGLGVLCSFMYPHPYDTPETIRETKKFMKELIAMGAKISLSFTTPYPGTYLFDHAEDLGIEILADSWDEYDAKHLIITTRDLSKNELEELLRDLVVEVGLGRLRTQRGVSKYQGIEQPET